MILKYKNILRHTSPQKVHYLGTTFSENQIKDVLLPQNENAKMENTKYKKSW